MYIEKQRMTLTSSTDDRRAGRNERRLIELDDDDALSDPTLSKELRLRHRITFFAVKPE